MRSPEKIVLAVISAVGIAYLIHQGATSEQQRKVEPNLPSLLVDAGASDESGALPAEKPAPGFTKQIKDHLDAYEGQFRAEQKEWMLIITEPVRIKVKEPLGIFVRNLPDQNLGRQVPTGMDKPYWKVLPGGSDQGVQDKFVVVQNNETKEVSIWAIRQINQGLEFFAIYHQGQDLVDLTIENSPGQTIPVKDLFERFLPTQDQTPVGRQLK